MIRELLLALWGHYGEIFIEEKEEAFKETSEYQTSASKEFSTNFSSGGSCFKVNPRFPLLHSSERDGFDRLVQLGYFYKQLNSFTDTLSTSESELSSLYVQALKLGINGILDGYEELIVKVEKGVILKKDIDCGTSPLSYLMGIFAFYRVALPELCEFVLDVKKNRFRGGKLLSALYRRTFTGNPGIEKMYCTLSNSCNRVFYNQVISWITSGRIIDPFGEFFIKQVSESKYTIVPDNVPCWLAKEVVFSVFFVGRVMTAVQRIDPNHSSEDFKHQVTVRLLALARSPKFVVLDFQIAISEFKKHISANLWTAVFSRQLKLEAHLRVFRNFFLLGFGDLFADFFTVLRNKLLPNSQGLRTRDLNNLFSLNSQRFTNDLLSPQTKFSFKACEKPPELDFLCFLSSSPIEWVYDLEWPLDLVLQEEDLATYSKLFSFLAGVRFVHLDLCSLSSLAFKPPDWWNPFWRSKAVMCHVLDALWGYLQVDVIDPAYSKLVKDLGDKALAYDFESIQGLHARYLHHLNHATLLASLVLAKNILVLLKAVNSFTILARSLLSSSEAPSSQDLEQLIKLDKDFLDTIQFIFRTLTSLNRVSTTTHQESHQYKSSGRHTTNSLALVHRHLDQLLLRLDFNRWFSRNY